MGVHILYGVKVIYTFLPGTPLGSDPAENPIRRTLMYPVYGKQNTQMVKRTKALDDNSALF